ncbi:MAG: hypothetical protein P4L84_38055 [Isosphaeraceae bacterium]|nr:hypothetical protein [Isosphaeraceae bacterium]
MSIDPVAPDPELSALENALGALAPAKSRIDRDRVMFLAGQAAARPPILGRRAWMAIAASLGIVALGEAGLLALHTAPKTLEKIVVVREPAIVPPSPQINVPRPESLPADSADGATSLGRTAYERLAGQVLRYGLDGLPASPAPSASWANSTPMPPLQLMRDELRNVFDIGDPS